MSPANADCTSSDSPSRTPAVIIVGPPWRRSAAVRVIQSQIQYYRERGFVTVFVSVPFLWCGKNATKNPKLLPQGINELDADTILAATFDQKTYDSAKYRASNRRAFLGTVVDWQVAIARANRLSDRDINFLRGLQVALVHDNYLYTLGFALDLRKQLFGVDSRLPIILETHDVQSRLTREKCTRNPRTGRVDSLERLVKSETALVRKANVLIHLSSDDLTCFKNFLPSKPQFLVFPAIDEKFRTKVTAAPVPNEAIDLLFVGQWHYANLQALKWFFKEIWPVIAHRHYSLKIVGLIGQFVQWKQPRLYDRFRSFFVGEVNDLVPYYRAARCVIAPMRSGTGISIKTIEALALGKPFIGTSKAFRGMPIECLRESGIRAFDDAQGFAQAISWALSGEHEAAAASRAAYDAVFSVSAAFASRDEALRAATALGQAARRGVQGREMR